MIGVISLASAFAGALMAATAVLDCIGDSASARGGARWLGSERLLPLDTSRKLVAIQRTPDGAPCTSNEIGP